MKCPPFSQSSRAPNTLGESKRGQQNQSMVPSVVTKAAVCRSPIRPWFSISGYVIHQEPAFTRGRTGGPRLFIGRRPDEKRCTMIRSVVHPSSLRGKAPVGPAERIQRLDRWCRRCARGSLPYGGHLQRRPSRPTTHHAAAVPRSVGPPRGKAYGHAQHDVLGLRIPTATVHKSQLVDRAAVRDGAGRHSRRMRHQRPTVRTGRRAAGVTPRPPQAVCSVPSSGRWWHCSVSS